MIWQDLVIAIVSILFAYALIPQVIKGFREKKKHIAVQTGLINAAGMYAVAVAYASLGLIFSTIFGIITATLWLVLFIQSIIYKK